MVWLTRSLIANDSSRIDGIGHVDHEPVPDIRFSQAVHCRVDITHLYELNIRNDIMLGTEVKHLLCLLHPSNLTPSHHFPSCKTKNPNIYLHHTLNIKSQLITKSHHLFLYREQEERLVTRVVSLVTLKPQVFHSL